MRSFLTRWQYWLLPTLAAILFFIAGSTYRAFAASTTFYACLTSTGTLTKVSTTAPKPCGTAKPVQWNQVGPTGPQGATGPQGPQAFVNLPSGADLSQISTGQTDLRYRNFANTSYYGVDLYNTNLTGASFDNADLRGVRLDSTTLYRASLNGANLTSNNLSSANLSNATLLGANLQNTNFYYANLSYATLLGATNLNTANVFGVTWLSTICPDGSNSSTNGANSCIGH